ncbi:NADP-dependent oxidoreductase domain-containing protein [Aspergillus granulosus]|uniref:NADP-dependent oxidoreductase domain-containing protein n=1 Tax=Aspergillus granulosus TaxID=176169 RepID=A0ABR4HXU4_9EURO
MSNPQIPPIGLGFGSLSGSYGPPGTLEERLSLLDHAHATGLHHWDMADVYGDSEDVVGEWIKSRPEKRNDIFIATKFGLQWQAEGKFTFRSDPAYVREALEKSLRRLGVERIDLYYCHRVDGVTPIERTVQAMVELKKEGKIKHIGLSEVSVETLHRAHAVHPITALQMEYSLFTLDIESPPHSSPSSSGSSILSTARTLGTTIVAYSPIGRGILSGSFPTRSSLPPNDLRTMYPKYAESNFPAIMELVRGIEEVARRLGQGVTAAQVALAWVLAQGKREEEAGGFRVVAIPGTKSRARMEENADAERVAELLSEADVEGLRSLAEGVRGRISGGRYPAATMATLCTDTPPL